MASHLSLAQWANLFQRRAVVVPGLRGSNPFHWQSQWQARFPHFVRADVQDWSVPSLAQWYLGIEDGISQAEGSGKPILIGHSFGSLASAIYAARNPEQVGGLLLVAPASHDKFNLRHQLEAIPNRIPVLVIGSENDPWMPEPQAREFADILGADYHLAGPLGHINVASGVGAWWEGLYHLRQVADRVDEVDALLGQKALFWQTSVMTRLAS